MSRKENKYFRMEMEHLVEVARSKRPKHSSRDAVIETYNQLEGGWRKSREEVDVDIKVVGGRIPASQRVYEHNV